MSERSPRSLAITLAVVLALVTFGLYASVSGHEFVTYDDDLYVTDNPMVGRGLTADGLTWAFTSWHASNWHPLTWLSHMLDVELFGMDAGAHHRTNAVLHALNAGLLLLVLTAATRRLWPSAFIAALFALHPLRVESVAWVSERKDVLSGLFFLLTLASYVAWTRRGGAGRYALVVIALAAGLMAKPMLVSVPLVLFALDRWPLERWSVGDTRARIVEKLPLFALALASCIVTPLVQAHSGVVRSLAVLPIAARVSNAFVATARYIGQTLWPTDLAVYYPHPAIVDAKTYSALGLGALLATGFVVLLVVLAVRCARSRPYVTVGVAWTALMLAPVIGLIQVGEQALADRYTYLPMIGLSLAAVFVAADGIRSRPALRIPLIGAGFLALAGYAFATHGQIQVWRNNESLFRHALAVTEKNYVAHNNLALSMMARGELDEAERELLVALELQPENPRFLSNLGLVTKLQGRLAESESYFAASVAAWPEFAGAHNELGVLAFRRGDRTAALEHLRLAAKLRPGDARILSNLGSVLMAGGDWEAASQKLSRAVQLEPDRADHHVRLGTVWIELGRWRVAASRLERALQLEPNVVAAERLAWVRAAAPIDELRDGRAAVQLAERAAAAGNHRDPRALATLAAAHAEAGDFAEAQRWQARALELAPQHVDVPAWRQRAQGFAQGRPHREAMP